MELYIWGHGTHKKNINGLSTGKDPFGRYTGCPKSLEPMGLLIIFLFLFTG
jgi:hypothetical protein